MLVLSLHMISLAIYLHAANKTITTFDSEGWRHYHDDVTEGTSTETAGRALLARSDQFTLRRPLYVNVFVL